MCEYSGKNKKDSEKSLEKQKFENNNSHEIQRSHKAVFSGEQQIGEATIEKFGNLGKSSAGAQHRLQLEYFGSPTTKPEGAQSHAGTSSGREEKYNNEVKQQTLSERSGVRQGSGPRPRLSGLRRTRSRPGVVGAVSQYKK